MAPSLLLWIFQPDEQVPLWSLVVAITATFLLLWAFTNSIFMYKSAYEDNHYSQIQICNSDICLCSPLPALSHGTLVSIYLVRNECEHQIGYGEVNNIQDNGLVALTIYPFSQTVISNDPRPFSQIISENKKDILIKTSVSRKTIDYIFKETESHEKI